jgi:hypothetical protein
MGQKLAWCIKENQTFLAMTANTFSRNQTIDLSFTTQIYDMKLLWQLNTVEPCVSGMSVWTEVAVFQGLALPPSSGLDGRRDSLQYGSLFHTDMAFQLRKLH